MWENSLPVFIQGLAGRDVRKALEIFESILRSGHLSEEAITSKVRGGSAFVISEDAILKTVMRGDYNLYSDHSGFVANIFHLEEGWQRPSLFLTPDLLFWLYDHRKSVGQIGLEGFFSLEHLFKTFEIRGYVAEDIERSAAYLLKMGLLEADHYGSKIGSSDDSVRLTSSGFIHLRILIESIEYLYSVIFITPLHDRKSSEAVSKILDAELSKGVIPDQLKLQAVSLFFGALREEYVRNVNSYPGFRGADSGASYVVDRLEAVIAHARSRTDKPLITNPLDSR